MPKVSGGKAIVQSIVNNRVDTLFGLPGAQIYELYNALYDYRDQIRIVSSRHEQGAAYMAFGYAHSTGKVGVYAVVPGPGLLNTGAALLTAYGCNARVLCLAGQIPAEGIGRGVGYLHELPGQLELMGHLTKWAARIDRPADAPVRIDEAFQRLRTGRPRPVEIEMCMDVMAEQGDVRFMDAFEPPAPAPADPELIDRAARRLGRAERPLIMVGGGAVEAGAELLELAEMLQAPVVSFRHGRGIVSARHYLAQSLPAGHRLWAQTDCVLAVGTRLEIPLLYWGTGDLDIVRIDIDPEEIDRVRQPAVGIVADAKTALAQLLPAAARFNRKRASRRDELTTLAKAVRTELAYLEPQRSFLKVIREELPEDGILVDEITQVAFVAWLDFPVYAPRTFISSGYQGNLGFGFATALGVRIGNPDKKVLHIAGDGGFMYTMPELATAVRDGIDLVTVIFRDDKFGNVHRDQKHLYGDRVVGSTFHNPDFVALAESFGANGLRANGPEPLRAAIRQAFAMDGPTLIEVPVDEMPNPWKHIMLPRVR